MKTPSRNETLKALASRIGNRAFTQLIQRRVTAKSGQELLTQEEEISRWLEEGEEELPSRWSELLGHMVSSDWDVNAFANNNRPYQSPEELLRHLLELSILVKDSSGDVAVGRTFGQWLLLKNIRQEFFPDPAEKVLYLGSGEDLVNPVLATGSPSYVFVDREELDIAVKNVRRHYTRHRKLK